MAIMTVEDVKAHLNLTDDHDDDLVGLKIGVAEAMVASYIGVELDDAEAFPSGPPEPIKEAVRKLVAEFYENREANLVGASFGELTPGVYDLLAPYRQYCF
jgi:hypothetical protein